MESITFWWITSGGDKSLSLLDQVEVWEHNWVWFGDSNSANAKQRELGWQEMFIAPPLARD